MNDAVLIFVSRYFLFSLRGEAIIAARFCLIIEGIKEILEWFQYKCNLLFFGSLSFNRRFMYAKQLVLV